METLKEKIKDLENKLINGNQQTMHYEQLVPVKMTDLNSIQVNKAYRYAQDLLARQQKVTLNLIIDNLTRELIYDESLVKLNKAKDEMLKYFEAPLDEEHVVEFFDLMKLITSGYREETSIVEIIKKSGELKSYHVGPTSINSFFHTFRNMPIYQSSIENLTNEEIRKMNEALLKKLGPSDSNDIDSPAYKFVEKVKLELTTKDYKSFDLFLGVIYKKHDEIRKAIKVCEEVGGKVDFHKKRTGSEIAHEKKQSKVIRISHSPEEPLSCYGCGRTGHSTKNCALKEHPDFNRSQVPWKDSIQGKN